MIKLRRKKTFHQVLSDALRRRNKGVLSFFHAIKYEFYISAKVLRVDVC